MSFIWCHPSISGLWLFSQMQNDMQIYPSCPAASSFVCLFPRLFFPFPQSLPEAFAPLAFVPEAFWEAFVPLARPGTKRGEKAKKTTLHLFWHIHVLWWLMSLSHGVQFHFCSWKTPERPLPVYILPWQFFSGFRKHRKFIVSRPPSKSDNFSVPGVLEQAGLTRTVRKSSLNTEQLVAQKQSTLSCRKGIRVGFLSLFLHSATRNL